MVSSRKFVLLLLSTGNSTAAAIFLTLIWEHSLFTKKTKESSETDTATRSTDGMSPKHQLYRVIQLQKKKKHDGHCFEKKNLIPRFSWRSLINRLNHRKVVTICYHTLVLVLNGRASQKKPKQHSELHVQY